MQENTPIFQKQLTWACDLIILNAFCLTILQVRIVGENWLLGLSLINCIAMIALRQWLMHSLQISGMVSPLNRGIKRAADILISITFLITVFPVIIVIQTFIIKGNKQTRGPLFAVKEVCVGNERCFTALVFSNCKSNDGINLRMTPLAIRLLTGMISLSDIPLLSIRNIEEKLSKEPNEDILKEEREEQPYDIEQGNLLDDHS